MADAKVCDKCGKCYSKVVTHELEEPELERTWVARIEVRVREGWADYERDVCPACQMQIVGLGEIEEWPM